MKYVFTILFALAFDFFATPYAQAHPMDIAKLNISIVDDRLVAIFRLHPIAAERFVPNVVPENTLDYSTQIFRETIGKSVPKLNTLACQYLLPSVRIDEDDPHYINLSIVITCPWTLKDIHFEWDLPFLASSTDTFQIIATFPIHDQPVTMIASRHQPRLEFGENSRTFLGFVKMGMGHIGAWPDEWRGRNNQLQLPEGIDHIFFIIALVLAGGSLLGLVKTATGFTLGHSITLALAVYKIIHIHSKWIEVGIAFSIAYVAGRAFWKKGSRSENWIIACLFGIVHGLGFSGPLQDLELGKSEVFTALAGFNVGVEIGQCFFIFLILAILVALGKISIRLEERTRRVAAFLICLIGIYWLIYRAIV